MENHNPKILVTGATGFIGQVLCAQLQNAGYKVRALLRNNPSREAKHFNRGDLEKVLGDLDDKSSLEVATQDIDIVIHLAGIAHVNNVSSLAYKKTIVAGSENLFHACVANKVKKIIFLSSALAETANQQSGNVSEYAKAKLEAESLLQQACNGSETEFIIFRPVNVYGIGMQGNIANMIRWKKRGFMPALPKVDTKLSLIGINDLVAMVARAISDPSLTNSVYLLAEPEPYGLLDIEGEICHLMNRKIPTWRTPRVLLYAAAATAGVLAKLLGLFGIKTPLSSINLRTYYNLVNHSVYDGSRAILALNFVPKDNLIKQLPAIIRGATEE